MQTSLLFFLNLDFYLFVSTYIYTNIYIYIYIYVYYTYYYIYYMRFDHLAVCITVITSAVVLPFSFDTSIIYFILFY